MKPILIQENLYLKALTLYKNMKTRIGISWLLPQNEIATDKRSIAYIESIKRANGEPIYLPLINSEEQANELLKDLDGLLMTGGDDVDPTLYYENNLHCEAIDEKRDKSDCLLLKCAIKKNIPVLCICRGMQILNVVCGGSLYQDLNIQNKSDVIHRDSKGEVYVSHPIKVIEDSHLYRAINVKECYFNGWHHQAIKKLGKGLKVCAIAEDGVIEAVELETAKYIYGVQFHPERYTVEKAEDASKLFKAFVYKCESYK